MAYLFVQPQEQPRRKGSFGQWLEKVDAIMMGSSKLPTLDPFDDICPLMGVIPERETLSLASLLPKELESYKRSLTEDENDIASDDSEWEVDVDEDANDDIEMDGSGTFDLFEN